MIVSNLASKVCCSAVELKCIKTIIYSCSVTLAIIQLRPCDSLSVLNTCKTQRRSLCSWAFCELVDISSEHVSVYVLILLTDCCHLDTRRMWPGCDDILSKPYPLAPGARTICRITPKLAKLTPKVFDHIVGNHVVQSFSEKTRRHRDCGCITQLSP